VRKIQFDSQYEKFLQVMQALARVIVLKDNQKSAQGQAFEMTKN
jgi:hypothetical protein